jgi:hypothetical protein
MGTESWKEIEGYPDYMVSDHGNVLSRRTMKTKVLKAWIHRTKIKGMPPLRAVVLYGKPGERHKFYTCVLVARAFLNYRRGEMIRHLNGNTLDDRKGNLVCIPTGLNDVSEFLKEIKAVSVLTQIPTTDLLNIAMKELKRRLQQEEETHA